MGAPGNLVENEGRIHRLRLFLILGSLTAVGPIAIDACLPAFPTIAQDFHVAASSAQLTLTGLLVGLTLGQVVAGPLSDVLGRRRPLLIGLAAYAAASLACAVAPSAEVLIVFRVIQGLGAATGVVIARAVVRDLFTGDDAARFFSLLVIVTATSPIFAPLLGSFVLRLMSWRGSSPSCPRSARSWPALSYSGSGRRCRLNEGAGAECPTRYVATGFCSPTASSSATP